MEERLEGVLRHECVNIRLLLLVLLLLLLLLFVIRCHTCSLSCSRLADRTVMTAVAASAALCKAVQRWSKGRCRRTRPFFSSLSPPLPPPATALAAAALAVPLLTPAVAGKKDAGDCPKASLIATKLWRSFCCLASCARTSCCA